MTKVETVLLPCPFCGRSEVRSEVASSGGGWWVGCCFNGCAVQPYTSDDDRAACEAAWNRRTSEPQGLLPRAHAHGPDKDCPLCQAQAPKPEPELAWLIEMKASEPHLYFCGTARELFDKDVAKAVRFTRREDAERTLEVLHSVCRWVPDAACYCKVVVGRDCYEITEHMWPRPFPHEPSAAPNGDLYERMADLLRGLWFHEEKMGFKWAGYAPGTRERTDAALREFVESKRSQPEPSARYYCMQPGCPGDHPGKYGVCVTQERG